MQKRASLREIRAIGGWSVLVFVDESEWPRPKAANGFTVWGAIAIHPSQSREFFRQVYQLERKFWKVSEPYEFEIKGRLLLNKVLDFVQCGGPERTELRTFRWEVSL